MADLQFTGTPEERQRQMENAVIQLWSDWHGNGRPGMLEVFRTFMDKSIATTETLEKETEKRHRENSLKLDRIESKFTRKTLAWTIAGVFAAIAAIILTVVLTIVGWKIARNEWRMPMSNHLPVLSEANPQNAGSPTAPHF